MQKVSYHLDKNSPYPLYQQLYQQIKWAIHHQKLKLGERLPSKRYLCQYLQISQNTVENAYGQLLAEGYIESFARQGYYVCFQAELQFSFPQPLQKIDQISSLVDKFIDFNPNYIDTRYFPFEKWRKSEKNLFNSSNKNILKLDQQQGDINLRQAICDYLFASRGVNCQAEQIIINAGVENCLQQLILLFNYRYEQNNFYYGMESYGYDKVEQLLKLNQKNVIKIPLTEKDLQLDLSVFENSPINIAYITPSHLYPFGNSLSISQRQQLLEWAMQADNRFIIEDDYDSEFRYKGKPIPALKSLDVVEKVIYIGSFSKLLMPSLRLTFMVLPHSLLTIYRHYYHLFHCPVSRFEQQRLANFIQNGELEKHINRMRKIYRRKMELLCSLLMPYQQMIRYYGEHSGFYLLIEILVSPYSLDELCQRALQAQIKIYPIDFQQKKLILLGFGDLTEEQIKSGVAQLIKIWFQ